jgi:hypothetical protein
MASESEQDPGDLEARRGLARGSVKAPARGRTGIRAHSPDRSRPARGPAGAGPLGSSRGYLAECARRQVAVLAYVAGNRAGDARVTEKPTTAEVLDQGNRRTRLAAWASRLSVAGGGLPVCAGCAEVRIDARDEGVAITLLGLFGIAIVLFPILAGLSVLVGRRSSRRRLLKILVSLMAGGICGMLWVLFIATIRAVDLPAVLTDPVLLAVGMVVALSGPVLLSGPGRLGEVVGRSLMTTGFNSLALPIAALISFLLGGAQVSPGSARPELSAVILGVRLAGNVTTASLSVGGFLAGVFLVFLGDRRLRRVRLARRAKVAAASTPIRGPFRHE